MRSKRFKVGVTSTIVAVLALTVAVSLASSAGTVGSGTASAKKAVCGKGTGKKATGTPIKLGGIDMLIPGVDFTTIGKIAKAYFDCVNDNGGINGRPIKYTLYSEQLNPAQEAALARKLIQSDKVVGVVGNTSFAECGTNWKYYKSKGYVVIGAGVQAECYSTPSFAEVNAGPRYSQRRRRAGADHGRRQEARDRLAGHDLGVRGRRAWPGRQGGTASRSRSSRPTCRSPTRPRSCSRCTSSPVTAAASCSTSPRTPRRPS